MIDPISPITVEGEASTFRVIVADGPHEGKVFYLNPETDTLDLSILSTGFPCRMARYRRVRQGGKRTEQFRLAFYFRPKRQDPNLDPRIADRSHKSHLQKMRG